ncbi:hypothetical protein GCM10011575_16060 [Microlunatus endophyticus]|uniref:HTH cro/C1-type domain-containing protein n=1 Tax=Microlunatus endophyticus TaxID=1716077 RepID=A0A917W1M3_9ACTN|nr:ROK family transcriptional regulator [Microlunatus endophyticus]GGL58420.1 hypothetical protein GCM10011575_16060 [Microlunatus endophyticus]
MTPARPSLELLRSLTDEHVLRALIAERRLTRAEIAARTGISKPTIGESVRRLTEAGKLRDTGERTTGRGRIGSYYALAEDLGSALVIGIAPEGVVAESIDVYGDVLARTVAEVGRPAHPERVGQAVRSAATEVLTGSGRARLAVVSAADPVDRSTGRLVHLPYAPFLIGELDPVGLLGPGVDGPVIVDNDVNWAAVTERAGSRDALDDFAYLYLAEGLGCAVVADGEVRRGDTGLAGEIADLLTVGTDDRAAPFVRVFAELGLLRPDSTAIDVDALTAGITGTGAEAARLRTVLGGAIAGVIVALIAVADPRLVVLGGSWGSHPAVVAATTTALARHPRAVPVRAPQLTDEPALAGARQRAVDDLQALLTGAPGRPQIRQDRSGTAAAGPSPGGSSGR